MANPELEQTGSGRDRLIGFAALLTLAAGVALAIQAGSAMGAGDRLMALLATVVFDGGYVLTWLAAAAGYGTWAWRVILGRAQPYKERETGPHRPYAVQMAIGCAVLIVTAWVMGWFGWLNAVSGWVVLALGWGLLLVWLLWLIRSADRQQAVRLPWPLVLGGPAVGLLITASTVATGVLWQPTEKAAYDVLSYHLQLPAEWLEAGRILGMAHNVYAYLPSGFEAVYYHLAVLRGSAVDAAISCQMLHAAMALIAAGVIAGTVRRLAESAEVDAHLASIAGAAAGAIYLAVPWVIITGTLAYNEQAMAALGTAALAIAFDSRPRPWRRGLAAGLLVGVAMLCKLTAMGCFALPVAIVLLGRGKGRWMALLTFILGSAIPVGLFVVRNALWTGNPVFPMLTELFGTAHWSAEQAARWNAAHTPDLPWVARLGRIVDALLLHRQYGYLLWPATMAALAWNVTCPAVRRISVLLGVILVIQLLFWLAMTHVQSRFMVTAVVPAAMLIGIAISQVRLQGLRVGMTVAMIATITTISFSLYLNQYRGMVSDLIGQTAAVQQLLPPWGPFNEMDGDIRVYAVGDATPFYFNEPITYHTVWDASPLGHLIDDRGVVEAIAELRRRGYTHLLIDRFMLNLWWSPGNYGYDPSITPQRLDAIRALGLPTMVDQPGVMVIYDLRPTSN